MLWRSLPSCHSRGRLQTEGTAPQRVPAYRQTFGKDYVFSEFLLTFFWTSEEGSRRDRILEWSFGRMVSPKCCETQWR